MDSLYAYTQFFIKNWLGLVIAGSSYLVCLILFLTLFRMLSRNPNPNLTPTTYYSVLQALKRPFIALVPLLIACMLLAEVAHDYPTFEHVLTLLSKTIAVIGSCWILIGLSPVVETVILRRFDLNQADNLKARQFYTSLRMLRHLANVFIVFIAVALVLLNFESVKNIGISLLASAGVAGALLGFAAQKSLANIMAGFQLAFTQPIKLDDVLVVENEWGKVEKITMTYVVLKIWDQRRLILPLKYFLENPFQNWTYTSSELVGTVFLYVNFNVNIEALRAHLTALLAQSQAWDGKTNVLQVTNSEAQSLELRILVSAKDSSSLWNLRCEIREKMIDYINKDYPTQFPRQRWQEEKA